MNAPTPTGEAIDLVARTYYREYASTVAGAPTTWDHLTAIQKYEVRALWLPVLTAAYPQIVADVLAHYAEQAADEGQWHAEAYLRDQADVVRP